MRTLKRSVLLLVVPFIVWSCFEEETPCQDIAFVVQADSVDSTFVITAEGIEELVYSWVVNDDVVETEELDERRDNIFDFNLAPGTYTICIVAFSEVCNKEIEFCLDVIIPERHDEEHEPCIGLKFEHDRVTDFDFVFEADFDGIEDITYTWYVDGDSVLTEARETDRAHRIERDFAEGVHEVCIVATSDRCGEEIFCREIVAGEVDCPELYFETEWESHNLLVFFAEFHGMEQLQYKWIIGDEIVDKENFDEKDTDHKLVWEFEPGEYKVCIVAERDGCEELVFCEVVNIHPETCPELSFTYEILGDTTHFFEADFEDRDSVQYVWYINDDMVDKENFDGTDTDHQFAWEFGPGEYYVCIVVENDRCEGVEFCKKIEIDRPCPTDLSFTTDHEGDNLYKFIADFEGKEDARYKWYINDDIVDKENFEGYENDHKLVWDFLPGTYTICIVLYDDHCETIEYCEEIVIDPVCPSELFFVSEADPEDPFLYTFHTDFDGRDHAAYKWYVNDEIVDSENYDASIETDHKLIWDFPAGTHNVCVVLVTDGCDVIEFCEEIVITDPSCIDLSFAGVKDENAPAYTFSADFEGRDDITYIWSVYINDDYQGGEVREAAGTDDHDFYWQFEPGVTYEICLKQDGGCTDKQVCQNFSVE